MLKLEAKTTDHKPDIQANQPLAEGIISLGKRGRNWSRLSNGELTIFARRFIEERGIRNRRGLQKTDIGLYNILLKRRLLDYVGFAERKKEVRNWASMSDEKIVEHARKFVEDNKIGTRAALRKKDGSLYNVLLQRGLLDKVIPIQHMLADKNPEIGPV